MHGSETSEILEHVKKRKGTATVSWCQYSWINGESIRWVNIHLALMLVLRRNQWVERWGRMCLASGFLDHFRDLMSSHYVHGCQVNGTQVRMAFQNTDPSTHPEGYAQGSKWLLSFWIWLPTRLLSELIDLWLVKLLASVGQNLPPLRICPWRDNHRKACTSYKFFASIPPLRTSNSSCWSKVRLVALKKHRTTWCNKTVPELPLDISMHKTSQEGSFFTVSNACSRLPSFQRLG